MSFVKISLTEKELQWVNDQAKKNGTTAQSWAKDILLKAMRKKSKFDLEKIYKIYPRKIGKTPGMKKLKITSQKQFENCLKAVENYRNHVKDKDPEFIKHFSTWVSEWTDWIQYVPERSKDQKELEQWAADE